MVAPYNNHVGRLRSALRLLDAAVHTPEPLRTVNALSRFAEAAA